MAKILILGGGFGGAYAALELEKRLKNQLQNNGLLSSQSDDPAMKQPEGQAQDLVHEITIVCRENFLLFTPMLHEVATGDVSITDIVCPLRQMFRRCRLLQGVVESIDLDQKKVKVVHCSGIEKDELTYDYLLIALGSESNFFGLPGVEQGALCMKTLEDAITLRNRMIASLEEAEWDMRTGKQTPLLTYVIAGAGFAGAETAAAINAFVREAIEFYPSLKEEMVRVVLVDLIPMPLPELGEDLGKWAASEMQRQKMELRMNTKISGYTDRGLEFEDGTFIKPVILVWTAGVTPSSVLKTLSCKLEKKRVVTNEFLEVPDYPGAWALGDAAMIIDPTNGKPYPPTAQHASRQGTIAGNNIAFAVTGKGERKEFKFKLIGLLAALGRRSGVAKVYNMRFSGLLAWMMWRAIYLFKLPQMDRRLRVGFQWMLDLCFPKDFVQFQSLQKPLEQNAVQKDEISA